ncbi:unnamed protein product [Cunninghamella echinulata]
MILKVLSLFVFAASILVSAFVTTIIPYHPEGNPFSYLAINDTNVGGPIFSSLKKYLWDIEVHREHNNDHVLYSIQGSSMNNDGLVYGGPFASVSDIRIITINKFSENTVFNLIRIDEYRFVISIPNSDMSWTFDDTTKSIKASAINKNRFNSDQLFHIEGFPRDYN